MALAAFDPRDLQEFTRTFEDLFDDADAASMTSFYTGFWRAAIARAATARARRTIRLHESHSSGDLGYALCTVTVDIPAAVGPSIAVWDATIWQRDPGGTWRIAVDISTPLKNDRHT
jgi:ketosteroid isomerase-like protein